MSDTIEQSARATTTPELHPKIEEMLARIAGEAGSEAGPGTDTARERAQAVSAFARALLRRLAEDDLEAITTDELYALATSAFAFADSRGLEPSAVRVFNADPDVHGYRCHGTVVEVATDDSPFLVDSVSEELTARGLTIKRLLHPVIGAVRDEQGRLVQVRSGREAEHRESFMHFEVDRTLGDEVNAELETRVRRILRDVSLVVRDFDPMQERVRHMVDLARGAEVRYAPEVVGEVAKFLEWLLQLNFVLLGYREYELLETKEGRAIRAVSGSGLGILSDVAKSTFSELTLLADLSPDVRNRIEDGELLIYSKTQAYSTVHRRARMDYIGVRKVAPDGSIVGEARLIGLFTSKAYMEPAAKTPLLHHKLEQLIAAEDLIPGSHDYKAVVSLFESFPKDELFQASAEELRGLVAGLLQLEKHGGIRVLIRRDLYGRNVSVVVALPRDRFNADLRKRLQGLFLERFHGTTIDYHLSLGETESARIFFTIHVAPGIPIPDVRYEELEREVELLSRSWEDDLLDALTRRVGEGRALALMEEYAPRFPDYYKANDEWDLVVDDVADAREARGGHRGVPRRARQRVEGRAPDAREALQDRRQGRSVGLHADPRGPRAPGRRRGADGGGGRGSRVHPRLRCARFTRRGARAGSVGRSRDRHDRRRVARGMRLRLVEPARHAVDPHVVGGPDPPRAPELPDARVRAVHRELPERRDGGVSLHLRAARADVRRPLRPRAGRIG